jgi:hypothetical protein
MKLSGRGIHPGRTVCCFTCRDCIFYLRKMRSLDGMREKSTLWSSHLVWLQIYSNLLTIPPWTLSRFRSRRSAMRHLILSSREYRKSQILAKVQWNRSSDSTNVLLNARFLAPFAWHFLRRRYFDWIVDLARSSIDGPAWLRLCHLFAARAEKTTTGK